MVQSEERPVPTTLPEDIPTERDRPKSRDLAIRLYGPPAVVISCWVLCPASIIVQFMTPRWDSVAAFVALFTFATLVCGFLLLPFVVLASAWKCCSVPKDKKGTATCDFLVSVVAWVILLMGFHFLPWQEYFTQ
ncbi:hypothetical protein IAD21_00852 [Abditibacteriota bacterium]|nr:hypothetical protein IAD21_00852 [Abditibacteriota bacterium]